MTQQDALATNPTAATATPVSGAAAVARVRPWHWAALVAILIAAVGLRVHGLSLNSLWIDELFSVETSSGRSYASIDIPRGRVVDHPPHPARIDEGAPPPWQIARSLTRDLHPPLYFVALRLWRELFGSSEAAMRGLSVVASVVGILALFDLGRHLFDPVTALWACLIMALAHQQIWYGQEVRGYAMMIAAILGAAAAVVRVERYGFTARRGLALASCLLAAMFIHYYAVAGCAAVAAYAGVRLRGRSLGRVAATVAAAGVVYAAAWGPSIARQLGAGLSDTLSFLDSGPGFAGRWFARLLIAPVRLFSPPSTGSTAASWGMWLLLLIPVMLVRRRPGLLLPILIALFCIALPAAFDVARQTLQLEHERYYLAAGPALYLLAAAMLADRRGIARHAVPAALAIYCVLSLPWVYVAHKADWRALGDYARESVRPGDLVVFHHAGSDWYSSVAYLAMDYYAPGTTPHVLFLDRPAEPDVLARVRSWPGSVWFFSAAGPEDAASALPGMTSADSRYAVFAGYFCRLRGTEATP